MKICCFGLVVGLSFGGSLSAQSAPVWWDESYVEPEKSALFDHEAAPPQQHWFEHHKAHVFQDSKKKPKRPPNGLTWVKYEAVVAAPSPTLTKDLLSQVAQPPKTAVAIQPQVSSLHEVPAPSSLSLVLASFGALVIFTRLKRKPSTARAA